MSEFFATHPKPDDRVQRLDGIAQREHLGGGADLASRFRRFVSH